MWTKDKSQFLDELITTIDGMNMHKEGAAEPSKRSAGPPDKFHRWIPALVLRGAGTIPAVMWRDIVEVWGAGGNISHKERAHKCSEKKGRLLRSPSDYICQREPAVNFCVAPVTVGKISCSNPLNVNSTTTEK